MASCHQEQNLLPFADQTRTLFVHGSVLVERQVSKTSERVPRGGDHALWSRSALISWRHSTGGRLIYGVLGRDDFSLTRDQTPICLLAGSGLNALLQPQPRGMQRGRAANPLAKMCGNTAHILQLARNLKSALNARPLRVAKSIH